MEKFLVTGMSCAACQAKVEKAVSKVPGVSSCAVNLLTNTLVAEGCASSEEIIRAVENAGYGASSGESLMKNKNNASGKNSDSKCENKIILKRLSVSLVFVLAIMYSGAAHSMWNAPLPKFFEENIIALSLLQMILSLAVLLINKKFFANGFRALVKFAPNMDSLIALGSGISFAYSTVNLFMLTEYVRLDDAAGIVSASNNFYFESSAMIVTLITLGKLLESVAKGRTTDALNKLIDLSPKNATVIRAGREFVIPADQMKRDDVFVVKPGESFAADGIIIEGTSSVNESALTGESLPRNVKSGDSVKCASINLNGFVKCRARAVGSETVLAKIISMVSDAGAGKAPVAKLADRVSGIFVPAVIGIALITFAVWFIAEKNFAFALARGISVLVISCPCALGLATPVAIVVGSGRGARNGILFKNAEILEETGKIKIVALDKTGTITNGSPVVSGYIAADGVDEKEFMSLAVSLESKSLHPLSKAVTEFGRVMNVPLLDAEDFRDVAGKGISGKFYGEECRAGNLSFVEEMSGSVHEKFLEKAEEFSLQGKTPVYFSRGNRFLGIIFAEDSVKSDSADALKKLKDLGLEVVMITGDNENTAETVASSCGADRFYASVMPDEKGRIIGELKKGGKVLMAGDGINDAPALALADVGVAMASGTDVAMDCSDVVLLNSSLTDLVNAIKLSRATLTNIRENLFWAFCYNVLLIPLAAGVYAKLFGWVLNPMIGAAAMSLSSFCVVTNALRLNFVKLHENNVPVQKASAGDVGINRFESENPEENMFGTKTKTVKVEGMMCSHCEAHVKEALEAVENVRRATASHVKGEVSISFRGELSDDVIRAAVEKAGYKVV